ncbi:homoserine dehydrogenase [Candidatus Oleimmundimicrobium sp.]|uniref:homoserine dehydrogenase n=1 Tax=Candidatus Oleimmundimicrobium sp. TaxID=3060597 RepID=UPI0027184A27|nr:homoserine dehydrogenase [Candidatus Oleimmundimicrobium sp.]MDO8885526.1 homoserine dehydrogenase [Candidatus Oleimmundimicrobium sp.]
MKDLINIGLIGLGTVGSGVYKILATHREDFKRKVGADLVVKAIAEKSSEKADAVGANREIITDAKTIIEDPDIDIVVEVIGGIEPAKSFILEAIKKGKHVVTANKELLASHGEEILKMADKNKVDVFFEASVGGGIPIIHLLKECLASNKILKVMGIVNGTTNYILTMMSEEGCSFEKALKEAQQKGYAERDPSADIEGRDAAAKIAILASIAFNSRVKFSDVSVEGISKITAKDILHAKEMNYVVKLLAVAKEVDEELEVRVHPAMIPVKHPLASVNGVYNAIFVEGDSVGEVMFFGQGAGSLPAASAVVGDIIEVARNIQYGSSGKIGCTCFRNLNLRPIDEINSKYYLLMNAADKPGVLAKIAKVFGDNNVSLASVIQKGSQGSTADLILVTHLLKEKNFRMALNQIRKLSEVNEICNVIRVEESNE